MRWAFLEYEIEYKKRRTLSVRISDGKVFVSAPRGMSRNSIETFLNEKSKWIEKNVKKQKDSLSRCETLSDNEALLFGEIIPLPPGYVGKRLAFYRSVSGRLAERTEYVAKRCGFTYSGLRFSRAQTRWGSCNGKNGITLNLALLVLPKRLSDYVIVHELCHTEHHDHSPAFWKRVESIIPEYKAMRKELKNYAYTLGFFK